MYYGKGSWIVFLLRLQLHMYWRSWTAYDRDPSRTCSSIEWQVATPRADCRSTTPPSWETSLQLCGRSTGPLPPRTSPPLFLFHVVVEENVTICERVCRSSISVWYNKIQCVELVWLRLDESLCYVCHMIRQNINVFLKMFCLKIFWGFSYKLCIDRFFFIYNKIKRSSHIYTKWPQGGDVVCVSVPLDVSLRG